MAGHARNAPSDSKRWLRCPGAINLCKKLNFVSRTSPAAAEGTAAHEIRERCLKTGNDPDAYLGEVLTADGMEFEVTSSMCDALQPGIDRIREFHGKLYVEKRVDITPWVGLTEDGERQYGTLDCGIVNDIEIAISDLKFGEGVPVEAVNNEQQLLYLRAFIKQFLNDEVGNRKLRIIIDQPRNNAGGGEWVIDFAELKKWAKYCKERAALTYDENAPCIPSKEACFWCPAAKIEGACNAHDKWVLEMFLEDVEDLDADEFELPDPTVISDKRKRVIYENISLIRKFIDRVEASVRDEIFAGEGEKYGKKVVLGKRSARRHKDELISELHFLSEGHDPRLLYTSKLKSPAQLEDTVLGKNGFPESLMAGGEKQPVVAPIEDARPAIALSGKDDIEDLGDDDDFD